jgi:hypothetical protein
MMFEIKAKEQGLFTFGHFLHSNGGMDLIDIDSDGTDLIIRVREYSMESVKSGEITDNSKSLDYIEMRIAMSRIRRRWFRSLIARLKLGSRNSKRYIDHYSVRLERL